jgi:hypothetical protein
VTTTLAQLAQASILALALARCALFEPAPPAGKSAPVTVVPQAMPVPPTRPKHLMPETAPVWARPPDPNLGWRLQTKSYGGTVSTSEPMSRKDCETARKAAIPKTDFMDTTKIEPTPAPGNIIVAECLPP